MKFWASTATSLVFCVASVSGATDLSPTNSKAASGVAKESRSKGDVMALKLKVRIGTKTFTATLLDNKTVTAFKAMLPLTIEMPDLNDNEKHADLPKSLPTDSSNPKNIHVGDLMIYGSKTIVLFYKSFPTSYSYTKLGKIDDVSGFVSAVGTGTVTVTFEAE